MNDPTDMEIMKRWADLQPLVKLLKRGKSPDGESLNTFKWRVEIETDSIYRAWSEIVAKRASGIMTDRSKIDAAKKIASDTVLLTGIPIKIREVECKRFVDQEFTYMWRMLVVFGGNRKSLDMPRWSRLMGKVNDELSILEFVSGGHLADLDFDPNEIPADYHERNYNKPGYPKYSEMSDDELDDIDEPSDDSVNSGIPFNPYLRPTAWWFVNTQIWKGPPRRRRQ